MSEDILVRCESCECAFTPEMQTERDGEIERVLFRCPYCGKRYLAAVTDAELRMNVQRYSIEYILHHRNPIETDGAGYPRTVTSEWIAKRKAESSDDRRNYDALIAMIPQEAINGAAAQFRDYFWQWTDRFYENLAPFFDAITQCDTELRESRVTYNKLVDEFSAAVDKVEKLRRQEQKGQAVIPLVNPLAAPPKLNMNTLDLQRDPLSILGRGSALLTSDLDRAMDDALAISMRMDRAGTRSDDLIDKANELYKNARTYAMHITRQGHISLP